MSSAEPSKANTNLSRWHRPRLYITIAGFYQLILGVLVLIVPFWLVSQSVNFGHIVLAGALYLWYFFFLSPYFAVSSAAAFYLLKSIPQIRLPIVVVIFTTLVIGAVTYDMTYSMIRQCSSGSHDGCSESIAPVAYVAGFLALSVAINVMLVKGWRLLVKQS